MKVSFKNKALDGSESSVKEWELNGSQEKFWKSKAKYVLFSGGFGCGKSLMLTLKAIEFALKYPGNYILMGRKTYPELRDTLIKEFFITCPDYLVSEYLKAEGRVIFKNKSEIIFRHLDTIAESEIRSLNLGAAFIDQAEDIPKEVFLGLIGRLRREGINDEDRKIFLSCNPKLTWLYADFKQKPTPEYEVIEASTIENAKNLSPAYVENLLKYPESWKKQYVYGVWDTDLLADRIVFAREYIEEMHSELREPLREYEGLRIYKEFVSGHRYQMGIDAAEGGTSGDEAAITIADLTTLEEVASWAGHVPPDVLGEYAAKFARLYQDDKTRCLLLPEMNSVGVALVNKLKQEEDIRMYRRQEYDKISGKPMEKLGWRTTSATKPLLISRFQELLRLKNPAVRTKETFEQFKSFVHTPEAKKRGMGAETGFHDDRLISCLLAFWEKGEVAPGKIIREMPEAQQEEKQFGYKIIKGKIYPTRKPWLVILRQKKWTVA